jgi:hypothetical protein
MCLENPVKLLVLECSGEHEIREALTAGSRPRAQAAIRNNNMGQSATPITCRWRILEHSAIRNPRNPPVSLVSPGIT